MQSFYISKPPPERINPCQQTKMDNLDSTWAVKVIKKASLKINDIQLKLQMSKVVKFIEDQQNQRKVRPHFVTFCQTPIKNSDKNLQLQVQLSEPSDSLVNKSSELQIDLSQSVFSRQLCEVQPVKDCVQTHLSKLECSLNHKKTVDKENQSSNFNKFEWRNVVTRNILEDSDEINRKKQHCKCKNSQILIQTDFDELTQEVRILKKSLGEIINVIQQSEVIESKLDIKNQKISQVESGCQKICQELVQRWTQIRESVRDYEVVIEQNEKFRDDIERKDLEMKEFELLMFIKDEEISSLKALKSDLENKMAASAVTQPKSARRTYKRYFQDIENNLSATQ